MYVIFGNVLSDGVLLALTPFILLVVGIVVETNYVGRVAMFTNASALYIFYHSVNMPFLLGLIVNASIIIGIIGGISRVAGISLAKSFYQVAWVSSSIVTAMLLLYGIAL